MPKTLKVALAGAGAFGFKHLDAIKLIDGVEAVSLVGRELDKTREAAAKYGIGHVATDLAEALKCRSSTRSSSHADADACRAGASMPRRRANMCRSRFRSPTV